MQLPLRVRGGKWSIRVRERFMFPVLIMKECQVSETRSPRFVSIFQWMKYYIGLYDPDMALAVE